MSSTGSTASTSASVAFTPTLRILSLEEPKVAARAGIRVLRPTLQAEAEVMQQDPLGGVG
eukprot:1150689-Pelagomonas_calceolata.AAC.4